MVNSLERAINQISDDLFVLDKAYIKYKSQNYISFTYYNATFMQRISIRLTIIEAAAVMLCGLVLFYVRRNRKGKKTNEKI